MNRERCEKCLDHQREALIHLAEDGNRLRKALMTIKELNDRRPHDASWRDIDGIIDWGLCCDYEKGGKKQ